MENKSYVVMVDYYSNFIEFSLLPDTRASSVIHHMKANMTRYGLIDIAMSDNGPQFTSDEFCQLTKDYEFQHITSSPYFTKSNGLAEKSV